MSGKNDRAYRGAVLISRVVISVVLVVNRVFNIGHEARKEMALVGRVRKVRPLVSTRDRAG